MNETNLPAVMNWIVKESLAMMTLFEICLRIRLHFCSLFNQEQKAAKEHLFQCNKQLTGLIKRPHSEIQSYRFVCFCFIKFAWPPKLVYKIGINLGHIFQFIVHGECHAPSDRYSHMDEMRFTAWSRILRKCSHVSLHMPSLSACKAERAQSCNKASLRSWEVRVFSRIWSKMPFPI